jgi:hypothetical protein
VLELELQVQSWTLDALPSSAVHTIIHPGRGTHLKKLKNESHGSLLVTTTAGDPFLPFCFFFTCSTAGRHNRVHTQAAYNCQL